jgi:hypothetical protein
MEVMEEDALDIVPGLSRHLPEPPFTRYVAANI